ncbi:DUF3617 family protein [Propionivibrio sp.]|uniref:DUF3617 domain-containing protein n=1 Tax=Propionivibrio sp. TaxID=2212460 RepID=UPI0025DC428E|nr:DUF3617 family protein [Propionivibrio sp.]MBK7355895.1 DUF3617 family protein [Propionivibrio sp.]MBK8400444.1 DUF3617 family protein [Propionivibrio sp.]MBK8746052.1 DUF3617 family protein [Propionivibrio sp.]MBK8895303.1 DUF3617 family protein [Propionivibrio sp.]
MNSPRKIRHTLAMLVIGLVTASQAGMALSADMPKRKAGLWEINMHMEGVPNMGAMQQCIDQNTDNLMQQQAKKGKTDCSVMDVKPSGNRVAVHSVCQIEGSTATTDGVFEGAFDSSYKGTMKTRYSPPMHGMSESSMTQEARWLGPCKPGQKPGDVIMPNMGTVNVNEMMKDPKMQEMMKRQQQR